MKPIFLLSALLFVFVSCSKSDEGPTRSEILREGTWKINSYKIKYYSRSLDKDSIFQILDTYPDCKKGDRLRFDDSYFGSILNGDTKCSPEEPEEIQFEWEFTNNQNGLRFHHAEYAIGRPDLSVNILRMQENLVNLSFQEEYDIDMDDTVDHISYAIELTR